MGGQKSNRHPLYLILRRLHYDTSFFPFIPPNNFTLFSHTLQGNAYTYYNKLKRSVTVYAGNKGVSMSFNHNLPDESRPPRKSLRLTPPFGYKYLKPIGITLFFALSYLAGCLAAMRFSPEAAMSYDVSSAIAPAAENWGLSFQEDGKPPVANATFDELKQYDAYYAENTDEKKIYLTFDCGYENGNTEALLDALKKHKASAAFFVVGNFISTSPELVKRMHEEGHTVGNHTYRHPDMSQISTEEAFEK